MRALDAAFGGRLAVDIERRGAALAEAPPSYVNSIRTWWGPAGSFSVDVTSNCRRPRKL